MPDAVSKMIDAWKKIGYIRFKVNDLDECRPSMKDIVSHDGSVVLGPQGEELQFTNVLGSGEPVRDLYLANAGEILGHKVARKTRGRFPEHWIRLFTGKVENDFNDLQEVTGYMRETFGEHVDQADLAALKLDSSSDNHDLFAVGMRAKMILEEIAESDEAMDSEEEMANVNMWRERVDAVVDNFFQGIHIARVNHGLKYDSGDMLAHIVRVPRGSGVYIGTRHAASYDERENVRYGICPVESILNLLAMERGQWIRIKRGQPYKATEDVVAELLMRDGQTSSRVFGTDIELALNNEAVVGKESLKKQVVGPHGKVVDGYRKYTMRAGNLFVYGRDFIDDRVNPVELRPRQQYNHLRVTRGAVTVEANGAAPIRLEVGSSLLKLPGAAFMVKPTEVFPSSFVASTLRLFKGVAQ